MPLPLCSLGAVDWAESQALYHVQAHLGLPALNILWPRQPYVCIGRFQDLELEVDAERCRERRLPIVRREVGGGAVYLDSGQVFYQLVLPDRRGHGDYRSLFSLGLSGVVTALKRLGVAAEIRGANDVVSERRKISGNGAGIVGRAAVVVGNILLDFDYEAMASVLRVPDEKFRDKAYRSMRENLVSLAELNQGVSRERLAAEMAVALAESLAPEYRVQEAAALPPEVTAGLDAMAARLTDGEWLHSVQRRRRRRQVRIRQGVTLFEHRWKAAGGLLRCHGAREGDRLTWVALSGDFFVEPADALARLEEALEGASVSEVPVLVARSLEGSGVAMPGVGPEDVTRVVLGREPDSTGTGRA